MEDIYKVLPHRDVLDCTMYSVATGMPVGDYEYEHTHCGMLLSWRDVVEANWCPYCAAVINKAAQKRGERHYAMGLPLDRPRTPCRPSRNPRTQERDHD